MMISRRNFLAVAGAAAAAALRADVALPLSVPRQKRGFPFVNRLDHRLVHK